MKEHAPSTREHKRLCAHCIGEEFLSEEIINTGTKQPCDYCSNKDVPTWCLAEVVVRVHSAILEHYELTPEEQSELDRVMFDEFWYREGSPVIETIEELAEVSSDIANDIRAVLEVWYPGDGDPFDDPQEPPFCLEAHYQEKGIDTSEWDQQWEKFEFALKEKSRFFNNLAAEILDDVFANIHSLPANGGLKIIETAGPGTNITELFRARAFQSASDVMKAIERPDRLLSAPPARFAASGRMNARGIAVFYGASNSDIALAEVRPPVGSDVVVACFKIIVPLKLLNLINLEKVSHSGGSLFDPAFGKEINRISFLRTLGKRFARPVMPGDQDIDYIATQAVADYLANHVNPSLDGIIFKSVQGSAEGYNIVLFHESSLVKELEIPDAAQVTTHMEADPEIDERGHYSVIEWLPGTTVDRYNKKKISKYLDYHDQLVPDYNSDCHNPTLEVDTQRLVVHSITAAKFDSDVRIVERTRYNSSGLTGDF
ncbi:RES family NAD+ phosphorylase [Marinobacter salicampi]|uniref:RES family NAD+ phosphorylase n=1 Tax=Marinobacter salicampi TaxID=435907 RepID=UPI00140A5868|nr:RES family NAD+ phosphorylase [Marinobacter salicampi]